MKKDFLFVVILFLTSWLIDSCSGPKAIEIPPGRYVNPDNSSFVPYGTDLKKPYDIYHYHKGKYHILVEFSKDQKK